MNFDEEFDAIIDEVKRKKAEFKPYREKAFEIPTAKMLTERTKAGEINMRDKQRAEIVDKMLSAADRGEREAHFLMKWDAEFMDALYKKGYKANVTPYDGHNQWYVSLMWGDTDE